MAVTDPHGPDTTTHYQDVIVLLWRLQVISPSTLAYREALSTAAPVRRELLSLPA